MSLRAKSKSLMAGLLIVTAQTAACSQGSLEQGKAFYAEGRLDKAQRCFATELAEDPRDASAHYLMANVYLALQRTNLAVSEYRRAQALDPNGQAGQLSRKALASIAAEVHAESPSQTGSTLSTAETARSDNYTRSSATTISRETNERSAALFTERDAIVKNILAESDQRCKNVEKEMYERININGTSSAFVPTIPGQPVKYTRYAQSIRDEYKPQLDAIKAEARRKVDDTTAYYRERAAAIEDNAISLDRSYVAPSGGMKLNPLGTDTYIHSYETSDEPSGSPVPVQAAPAKALKISAFKPIKKTITP